MTSRFPSAYQWDTVSLGVIPSEIINRITIYIWPILIIYIFMLIILIVKKTNDRKIYYPLSFFTLSFIILNLAIIYLGYKICSFLLFLIYPIVVFMFSFMIILSVIGSKLDDSSTTTKKPLLY